VLGLPIDAVMWIGGALVVLILIAAVIASRPPRRRQAQGGGTHGRGSGEVSSGLVLLFGAPAVPSLEDLGGHP